MRDKLAVQVLFTVLVGIMTVAAMTQFGHALVNLLHRIALSLVP